VDHRLDIAPSGGGIYFAILTLAFGQMVYYVFLSPLGNYTGGENGFTGVDVGSLFGVIELGSSVPFVPGGIVNSWMYLFVGTATVLAIVVGYRILNSPYGAVLRAVRENEQRAEFVGLNVWRYKLMSLSSRGPSPASPGASTRSTSRTSPSRTRCRGRSAATSSSSPSSAASGRYSDRYSARDCTCTSRISSAGCRWSAPSGT